MKTKHLLSTILFLIATTFSSAQSSIEQSGIAVQGIARDGGNAVRASQSINFVFTLYYKGDSDPIWTDPETLTTDKFGVFSHVIDNPYTNNPKISNYPMWLQVEADGVSISNEPLKHVPYAISANNGVPTGSIMPFVGEFAPAGWVLCNNQSLTSIDGAEALIALIGNNAPDLRGMFLRGAGKNFNEEPGMDFTGNDGPLLNEIQDDAYKNHSHPDTFSIASTTGSHNHSMTFSLDTAGGSDNSGLKNYIDKTHDEGTDDRTTNSGGEHGHAISGSVSASTTGIAAETRPVNYGVNYIIKL